jgi:hypothetical protein
VLAGIAAEPAGKQSDEGRAAVFAVAAPAPAGRGALLAAGAEERDGAGG